MPRYRIEHKITKEVWEVEADYAEAARLAVGWRLGDCWVYLWTRQPFVVFADARVAAQVIPPQPGLGHICPECNVTMFRDRDQNLWWRCPSCELIYHELEARFLRDEDI